MSGPVDVLAVLRTAKTFAPGGYEFREAGRAFAAVAELIEALRMSDEWIREAVNFGGCRLESSQTLCRNSQALARVGGAA